MGIGRVTPGAFINDTEKNGIATHDKYTTVPIVKGQGRQVNDEIASNIPTMPFKMKKKTPSESNIAIILSTSVRPIRTY